MLRNIIKRGRKSKQQHKKSMFKLEKRSLMKKVIIISIAIAIMILLFGIFNYITTIERFEGHPISVEKGRNETNWTLTIIFTEYVEGYDLNLVYIVIVKSNRSIGFEKTELSQMIDGKYHDGVRFINSNNLSKLDVGDIFIIDSTIYESQSTFGIIGPEYPLVYVRL